MKGLGQIQMDYRRALRKADELDDIAEDLKRLSERNLQSSLQNISVSWKSENASRYLEKGNKLGSNIIQTSRQIRQIASAVRNAARRTYEAEMRAYRIAMARKYNN